ncbi:MAG: hypothetical protein ABIL58_27355 [Pseudomonadota bacterium]
MARTNFSFKKRQQEIERKKKQDEKRQRKQAKKAGDIEDTPADGAADRTLISGSAVTEALDAAVD